MPNNFVLIGLFFMAIAIAILVLSVYTQRKTLAEVMNGLRTLSGIDAAKRNAKRGKGTLKSTTREALLRYMLQRIQYFAAEAMLGVGIFILIIGLFDTQENAAVYATAVLAVYAAYVLVSFVLTLKDQSQTFSSALEYLASDTSKPFKDYRKILEMKHRSVLRVGLHRWVNEAEAEIS
ncbi:hypothetical protein BSR29_02245 [Boudabousia liubingyangii]|uniref:Uncharacterized protein n=1 Tax=Boudabousia liubingyangii TaxID=1921764 RepID=A0A1Q5PQW0_9ACTO|nr:hypothetical protein [Boudabousia liubingyangii]OKL48181.1 hypothetical protein BSR28_00240 [Boudabousia liubingyangii]OKL49790.1 hypothetical protein BSR29_02245 [Boudabousia liubingyangii]